MRRVAAVAASTVAHVARVYTREQLLSGEASPNLIGASRRARLQSAALGRPGDRARPVLASRHSRRPHGTPYSYDAHIPLVLMGPGITAGQYHATVALNDLAPTLAAMLRHRESERLVGSRAGPKR